MDCYSRGFYDRLAEYGVQTLGIVKTAGISDYIGKVNKAIDDSREALSKYRELKPVLGPVLGAYRSVRSMDPNIRRALITALSAGTAHYLFSKPDPERSRLSGILRSYTVPGLIGGLAGYGLSASGLYDAISGSKRS